MQILSKVETRLSFTGETRTSKWDSALTLLKWRRLQNGDMDLSLLKRRDSAVLPRCEFPSKWRHTFHLM